MCSVLGRWGAKEKMADISEHRGLLNFWRASCWETQLATGKYKDSLYSQL